MKASILAEPIDQKPIELLGGRTLMIFGLYMLNAYYFWIPALAE
jgi:hypothetical protein